MDTSSVAGVHCEQAGSPTGGLTPLELEPFGEERGEPWPGKPPTARALAECIADLATNDRNGLIQRVRFIIMRDRATVRQKMLNAAKAEATATEAQHAGQWRPMSELPAKNRRITALYNDGSGSRIYFHTEEGQLFDGEDGCEYAWADRDQHTHWTYLPDDYRLWVEDCDEPMTFPTPPPAAPPSPAPPSSEREGSRAGGRYLDAEGKAP